MSQHPDLVRLDTSLLALRRLVDVPLDGRSVDHEGGRVELSTVLVVDAVTRLGAAGEQPDVGGVAKAVRVAHSTASRLVDRAVVAGMVERGRSDTDGRRITLTLTSAGQRLRDQAVRHRTARLAAVLADWPPQDVATLTRLLERFVADADQGPALRRRTS